MDVGSSSGGGRMRSACHVLLLHALLGLSATVLAAGQPTGVSADLPPALLKALGAQGAIYRGFEHGGEYSEQVAPTRIPLEVRWGAYGWISHIVAPQWLPEGGADLLTGETRLVAAIPLAVIDLLRMDVRHAGSDLRITEDPEGVNVLWRNPNITVGPDPGKTAALLAQSLLRVPDAEARLMRAEIQQIEAGTDGPLFLGRLTIPIDPLPRDQWENTPLRDPYRHMQWYHEMLVWLAPGHFYVAVHKRSGQPVLHPKATGGSGRRFLPGEGD